MYTYRNDKGATITTACEIAGGGWYPVSEESVTPKETRTAEVKEAKAKRKKNE